MRGASHLYRANSTFDMDAKVDAEAAIKLKHAQLPWRRTTMEINDLAKRIACGRVANPSDLHPRQRPHRRKNPLSHHARQAPLKMQVFVNPLEFGNQAAADRRNIPGDSKNGGDLRKHHSEPRP